MQRRGGGAQSETFASSNSCGPIQLTPLTLRHTLLTPLTFRHTFSAYLFGIPLRHTFSVDSSAYLEHFQLFIFELLFRGAVLYQLLSLAEVRGDLLVLLSHQGFHILSFTTREGFLRNIRTYVTILENRAMHPDIPLTQGPGMGHLLCTCIGLWRRLSLIPGRHIRPAAPGKSTAQL